MAMSRSQALRFAPSRPWLNGLACSASVAVSLVCGSAAFGDGGLLATTGVIGLASSLGPMTDADMQAVDRRLQSEALTARAAVLDIQEVIPTRPQSGGAVSRSESIVPASAFRPARPRTAGETRSASEPSAPAASTRDVPSRPSAKAPVQIEGVRPEVTRPITGDRPAMPFSRLLSQVRY
jgi:hypothetical protein